MSLTKIGRMESAKDFVALAKRWYELLHALAPDYTDITEDDEPPLLWDELPAKHRELLVDVFVHMIAEGTIR